LQLAPHSSSQGTVAPVDQTNQPQMTRPLRSTPITGASPLLRAGPPGRHRRRQRAFPCSMREPQTRLMPPLWRTPPGHASRTPPGPLPSTRAPQPALIPPLCRTPPGQSSGPRQVLLPQPGAWPRFRCPFVNVTTRQQRFGFTHLPGPHLALHRCLFHIAHHDGLQPTQHVVVWSLPPKGDSEGPTFISRTASTLGGPTYLLIKTSVRRSWRTLRRSVSLSGWWGPARWCEQAPAPDQTVTTASRSRRHRRPARASGATRNLRA